MSLKIVPSVTKLDSLNTEIIKTLKERHIPSLKCSVYVNMSWDHISLFIGRTPTEVPTTGWGFLKSKTKQQSVIVARVVIHPNENEENKEDTNNILLFGTAAENNQICNFVRDLSTSLVNKFGETANLDLNAKIIPEDEAKRILDMKKLVMTLK